MAPLDQKLLKQLLLKMIQNSRRRRSLMLKLTLFLKSRRQLLIQLAFLTASCFLERTRPRPRFIIVHVFWKWAFVAQWKFTMTAAIFRRIQTRHTRIFIIFKTSAIGSHVGKNWDWGWFIHLRLIHTLTLIIVWICVWFDSCEDRRLTQSRSSGVLHAWPGVQNASAAPNKISRT